MTTPLALDTAQFIHESLKEELSSELNFAASLSEFHENHAFFVEHMLEFLELCKNKKRHSSPIFNRFFPW